MQIDQNTHPIPASFVVVKVPGMDTLGVFTSVSGLSIRFDVLAYTEGGNNEFVHQLPGTPSYPNLTLTRGLTNQDAMLKWLGKTRSEPELKEITITYQDVRQQARRTFAFTDAYPVAWSGPTFDSGGAAIAMETLEIAHRGLKDV